MVHIHNGIFSYKINVFDSVLIKWRKLEPVIQIEVSQKEKNIVNTYIYACTYMYTYIHTYMVLHIYLILLMILSARQQLQMQTYRTDLQTQWERERVG